MMPLQHATCHIRHLRHHFAAEQPTAKSNDEQNCGKLTAFSSSSQILNRFDLGRFSSSPSRLCGPGQHAPIARYCCKERYTIALRPLPSPKLFSCRPTWSHFKFSTVELFWPMKSTQRGRLLSEEF